MTKVQSVLQNRFLNSNQCKNTNSPSFRGTIPNEIRSGLKMFVYDLDDSLLDGAQFARNQVMAYSDSNGRNMFYSSLRNIDKIQEEIDKGVLRTPTGAVAGAGINIFKKVDGGLREVKSWSQRLSQRFHKDEIRGFMLDFARSNVMTKSEYAKVDKINMPQLQKLFNGLRVTEYETYGSPLDISFMLSPGVSKEKFEKAALEGLAKNNITADIKFLRYPPGCCDLDRIGKFFSPRVAKDINTVGLPMMHPDGSLDVAFITAKPNKGEASEYLRNELGLKTENVLSAGDDVADFENAQKGYFFIPLNPTKALQDLISKMPDQRRIVNVKMCGAEGILEAIKP